MKTEKEIRIERALATPGAMVVWPQPEQRIWVSLDVRSGTVSQGSTAGSAALAVREALELYARNVKQSFLQFQERELRAAAWLVALVSKNVGDFVNPSMGTATMSLGEICDDVLQRSTFVGDVVTICFPKIDAWGRWELHRDANGFPDFWEFVDIAYDEDRRPE